MARGAAESVAFDKLAVYFFALTILENSLKGRRILIDFLHFLGICKKLDRLIEHILNDALVLADCLPMTHRNTVTLPKSVSQN